MLAGNEGFRTLEVSGRLSGSLTLGTGEQGALRTRKKPMGNLTIEGKTRRGKESITCK